MTRTVRIAIGSVVVACAVLALKLAAWWLTGSVALLADALESVVNVAAASAGAGRGALLRRCRRMPTTPTGIPRRNISPPCWKAR